MKLRTDLSFPALFVQLIRDRKRVRIYLEHGMRLGIDLPDALDVHLRQPPGCELASLHPRLELRDRDLYKFGKWIGI